MKQLDEETKRELRMIIARFVDPKKHTVFLFGSRATNQGSQWSDIDIGIDGRDELSLVMISNIKEAFEESRIPYKVDVVDFSTVSERFRNEALKKTIPLVP